MSAGEMQLLHPLHLFLLLLAQTGFSYSLLLDLLMSPETLFLVYLLNTLKHITHSWTEWTHACDSFHNPQSPAVNHHTPTCRKRKHQDSCSDTQQVIGQGEPGHLLVGGARVIVEYSSSSDDEPHGSSPSCRRLASGGTCTLCLAMRVLSDLAAVLSRLVANDAFPFDVRPLLRHLHRCHALYSVNAH